MIKKKALNLPINEDSPYRLFYPWKYGTLNNQDYTSVNAILGDLQVIWTEAIKTELGIEEADFKASIYIYTNT